MGKAPPTDAATRDWRHTQLQGSLSGGRWLVVGLVDQRRAAIDDVLATDGRLQRRL